MAKERNWHRLTGGSHSRGTPKKGTRSEPIKVREPSGKITEKTTLRRGDVFEPTATELTAIADKIEPVGGPGGAGGAGAPNVVADFVWRGLPMASEEALAEAVRRDVAPEDLDGVTPSGESGYGVRQIRDARPVVDDDEDTPEDGSEATGEESEGEE